MKRLYAEASYGRFSLESVDRTDGDVRGWFTIDAPAADQCDVTAWSPLVDVGTRPGRAYTYWVAPLDEWGNEARPPAAGTWPSGPEGGQSSTRSTSQSAAYGGNHSQTSAAPPTGCSPIASQGSTMPTWCTRSTGHGFQCSVTL